MEYFSLRFSLAAPIDQPQLVAALKAAGCESIQTSDGLCIRSPLGRDELQGRLSAAGLAAGLRLAELDRKTELPKDVAAFIGGGGS